MAKDHQTQRRLIEAFPELSESAAIEINIIQTAGDMVRYQALADIFVKGLFTKEIFVYELNVVIDIAIHTMKDVAT